MANKRYDVVAVTGTYTDRNGNEKKRYLNCGAVFETDRGLSLKLEAYPINSNGWFLLREPRLPETRSGQQQLLLGGIPLGDTSLAEEELEKELPF